MEQIKKGTITDKGEVDDIVYLTFSTAGGSCCLYTHEPIVGRKGLVCATIGNNNIPVGELKILNNGTKQ